MSSGNRRNGIKKRVVSGGMIILLLLAIICTLMNSGTKEEKDSEGNWKVKLVRWMGTEINRTHMPVFAFIEETGIETEYGGFFYEGVLSFLPVYRYSEEQAESYVSIEDEDTCDLLIRQEGSDEDRKEVEEGALEYGEDALHIDGDLQRAMLEENSQHLHNKNKEDGKKMGHQKKIRQRGRYTEEKLRKTKGREEQTDFSKQKNFKKQRKKVMNIIGKMSGNMRIWCLPFLLLIRPPELPMSSSIRKIFWEGI